MCIYIYIYIYIFSEAQKCPQEELPLVFVPVETPGGHPSK